jgi:uncharacterized membrane protein
MICAIITAVIGVWIVVNVATLTFLVAYRMSHPSGVGPVLTESADGTCSGSLVSFVLIQSVALAIIAAIVAYVRERRKLLATKAERESLLRGSVQKV